MQAKRKLLVLFENQCRQINGHLATLAKPTAFSVLLSTD